MVQKLVDRIGLAALQMDPKLIRLIQDVPTCEITDLYDGGCTKSTVVLADKLNLNTIYSLTRMYDMRLLVQTSHDNFNYNLIMSCMLSKYPDAIVKNPLPTIMRAKANVGSAVSFKFDSSRHKRELMIEVEKFLKSVRRLESVQQNAMVIANELMLNALYEAPVDGNGQRMFDDDTRSTEVKFPEGDIAEITLAFNEEQLVVGCRDTFGSLSEDRLTERLAVAFGHTNLMNIKDHNVCAFGLGLRLIIENSSGFGVIRKSFDETFTFATIPLGYGDRKVKAMPKNVYFKFY